MEELYKERLELLENDESFVLASIFDSQGSAPRTTGARMIIRKDGRIFGTVGGGKVEALTIEHGKQIFETKKTELKEYKLQEDENKGIGMACGGDVSILMEYVNAHDDTNLKLYKEVIKYVKSGEKVFIIRKFLSDAKSKNCLFRDGEVIYNKVDFAEHDIEKYEDALRHRELLLIKEKDNMILIEPVCNFGKLFILGAGHVSQKLAGIAAEIDFMTTVVDDRPEFANSEIFPTANEIIVTKSFENCFEELNIDSHSYIVIVTRGHLYDLNTLVQALGTDAYYIGMIGSRRKRDTIYKALVNAGFKTDDFNRVHNPIGIEIGAQTPAEIAVSIAAELINIRRDKMK